MIRVLISPARSGATLLNRCLGVFPNVVMISEVNPQKGGWGKEKEQSKNTIQKQMNGWFNGNIAPGSFEEELKQSIAFVKHLKKDLIIRDWTHVDFWEPNNHSEKKNKLNILSSIKKVTDDSIKIVALIRNPIDTWISFGMPNINWYVKSYQNFFLEAEKVGAHLIKYEDFCENPTKVMSEISDYYEIEYFPNFINEFRSYHKVNGDSQLSGNKGYSSGEIILPKRKAINVYRLLLLKRSRSMKELASITGYKFNYFDGIDTLAVFKESFRALERKFI